MRRTYILDTSVLINDPNVFKQFSESDVIIPVIVLSELDDVKKQPNEAGRNARVAIKLIDELSDKGDIGIGILIDNDIMVSIDTKYYDLLEDRFAGFGNPTYGDTQILACTYAHWTNNNEVCLVSNDFNLRVKAKARGIFAQACDNKKKSTDELYTGMKTIVNEEAGNELVKNGFIEIEKFGLDLYSNQFITFNFENGEEICSGRKIGSNRIKIVKDIEVWGIKPKNKEQSFAIDLMMDGSIDLVSLIGKAGGGKSICALAAATELVMAKKKFNKLTIYRPIVPVDSGTGWLPGELEQKLAPWTQPIKDNFEVLLGDHWETNLNMWIKNKKISFEALSFIRGRSIAKSLILVDEAQNCSREQIKTILTRAGEGSKVILNGDISQIDDPKLDAINNGLTRVVEKFKSVDIAGHITMNQCERSRLAAVSADLL
jgi:PhoH-like ATPase